MLVETRGDFQEEVFFGFLVQGLLTYSVQGNDVFVTSHKGLEERNLPVDGGCVRVPVYGTARQGACRAGGSAWTPVAVGRRQSRGNRNRRQSWVEPLSVT